MLPKKIIMENFGPFVHEEVDFDELTEAPLFLISGKTGAGKTTIFDAITFALYGDASGGVRSSNEIRSSFAEPTEETRVQFIFEHQGRKYSIERWPKQTLAKKNGKGETTKNQKVQLSIFNDKGQEAEAYTKVDAVNEVIYQILNLQKDQFRQIVMLPQGEFRTFLNANSTEKETVLRSLFGTSFYRQFTENLKLQKCELEKSVSEMTTRIDQLFQQVVAEKGVTYGESLNLAREYLLLEEQELLKSQTELAEKQAKQKALQQQLQRAQELSESFKQEQQTRRELLKIEEQLPEQEEKKQQLVRGRELEKIRPTYDRIQELVKQQIQQTDEATENQQRAAELEQQYSECQKQTTDFEQQSAEWQTKEQQLQSLNALLPLVKQKEQLMKQKTELTDKQAKQQEHLTEIIQQIKVHEEKIKLLETKQNTEKMWQDRRYEELQFQQTVTHLQQSAKDIFDQQEEEEDQQIKLAQLVEKASRTSNQLTSEVADYKKLKSQWASAEIARLSMDLLPGEPCPVCGSKEHPNPAQHAELTTDNLGQLQVALETQETRIKQLELIREQAEAQYEVGIKTFDQLQEDRSAAQKAQEEQINTLQATFADYYQLEVEADLSELVIFLRERQKETDERLAEINESKQTLLDLKAEIDNNQAKKLESETSLNVVKGELQTLEGRLSSIEEQTKEWQLPTLDAHIVELQGKIDEYHTHLQAHQALVKELEQQHIRLQENHKLLAKQQQETGENLEKFQTSLQQQLVDANLAIEQLASAPIDLLSLEQEITDFDQQLLLLKDRQSRLAEVIKDQEKPELDELQTLVTSCEAEVTQFQQQHYAKESQLQQQRTLIETIEDLQAQSKEQLDELSQMMQLYQTMNGDNPQKISLERYVLQWYLAEVLQCANQQLNQLTKGRYRFELKQETGRSKGNTGLEINVYDDNAGATRSSHTLSGGESFIAALSLALGLAEVIQSQAGGVAIEALFIDEGFGSLDEEALEMAMEALESIENAGRMIGIISHVRELKERIPQQIIVETSGTGRSSIRYQLEGWSET
ncbi:SMC family ATPase [Enterococcus avium]|uniref:SMC family ATPase n=1 Tax=Enterococcus avium TaxID=33945 RepID=UPI002A90ABFB|nr:SMC family ATPase [Enterococcus avium]MDY6441544.1 SMC family ATPase [Enterococcus avium]MDY6447268.1 SMC family ATPase [Enterococcus avium]MDY6453760.1 SMC family ATPase [Enterococcus avium]MDY6474007.1 SMC family ATPase [Enterococcus avium]